MHTTWANDPVNSPNHYTRSHPGMECIELTADTSFCLGNAIKYLWRYHSKGRPVEDLEKARWYLCHVIDHDEKIARNGGNAVRRNGRPYAVGIMPIVVASFAALAVGYGLGEQAQLGEQEAQTVTQEVRHTGDVKRLCLTVKTGGRIDAITCQVLDDMTGALS